MADPKHIALIDDDPAVRDSLQLYFARQRVSQPQDRRKSSGMGDGADRGAQHRRARPDRAADPHPSVTSLRPLLFYLGFEAYGRLTP
jgi:hypothetical protein